MTQSKIDAAAERVCGYHCDGLSLAELYGSDLPLCEVEEKLGALRTYVQNLLDEGVLALDDLPDAAKKALTPTKLAQLEASLGGG